MTTEIRSLQNRPTGHGLERKMLNLIGSRSRICVSARYGLELEICEQIRPIRGWVIVACRRSRRYNQLPGVFTTRAFAEAQLVRLVARWGQKFAPVPQSLGNAYWELEWDRDEPSDTKAQERPLVAQVLQLRADVHRRALLALSADREPIVQTHPARGQ